MEKRFRGAVAVSCSVCARLMLTFASLIVTGGCSRPPSDKVAEPVGEEFVYRGKVLAQGLAACGFCHGDPLIPDSTLAGGRELHDEYGIVRASNLTPSTDGIAEFSTEELVKVFRQGSGRKKRQLSTEVHKGYEWLSDYDLLALIGFLRAQQPVEGEVETREIGFVDRNTVGLLEARREVRGYVPQIDARYAVPYGEYLVDHVARCAGCHSSAATLLADEEYLGGGTVVKMPEGEKMAPNITGSPLYGVGNWSEDAIVAYLRTGMLPDGAAVDAHFCPVKYYARAPESDLRAIAKYLRTVSP